MATFPSKSSYFYLHPNAITFGFNALGDPDNLAISIYSNAKVSAYIRDVDENDSLGFTPADEYRQWTLSAFPTHFTDSEGVPRYAHIAVSRTTQNATIVFPDTMLDVYGRAITDDGQYFLDDDGNAIIPPSDTEDTEDTEDAPQDSSPEDDPSSTTNTVSGSSSAATPSVQSDDAPSTTTPSDSQDGSTTTPEDSPDTTTPEDTDPSTDGDYFFFFIGKITSSNGGTKNRQWDTETGYSYPITGTLDTARYWEEEQKGDWAKMFTLDEVKGWINQHFPINISKIYNLVMRGIDRVKEITIKGIFTSEDNIDNVPLVDLDAYVPTVGAMRDYNDGKYLSKIHDDTAAGNITFEQQIKVMQRILLGKNEGDGGNYLSSEAFVTGLLGYGFRVNEAGHGEFDSLSIRKFLEVPELRFNRVTVRTGVEWHTFGAGLIEEVIHPEGWVNSRRGIVKLKLEDGEYGAIAASDLCMGIYHYEGDATTEDVDFYFDNYTPSDDQPSSVDAHNGNFAFAGFATIYFKIIGACDENGDLTKPDSKNQYFVYELRDNWTLSLEKDGMSVFNKEMTAYHPQPNMSFACYANPDNPERQSSEYRTTEYSILLTGMTDWTYSGSNIAFVRGNLNGFTIPAQKYENGELVTFNKQLVGYGLAFGNAYMWGTIDQFDRPAYIVTQQVFTMLTSDTTAEVQQHIDAADWQTYYEWSSGVKSPTADQPYCYTYWLQTYDDASTNILGPVLTGYHTSIVSLELSKEIVSVALSDWYIDGEEGTDDIEFDVSARLKLGNEYAAITSATATSSISGFSYTVSLEPDTDVIGTKKHSYARFHVKIQGYVAQNIDGVSPEDNFVNITLYDEYGNNATRPVTITENRQGADGENGEKGEKGDPGTSLSKVVNYYAWHTSGDASPYAKGASDWSVDTIPSHPDGKDYLWNYEDCLDSEDVFISGSDPACIGYYPNDGVGIESITEYYKLGTSATTPPEPLISLSSDSLSVTTTGWSLTPPPTDSTTNKYLWNCEVVKFSDSTYQVNTPHVAGTHGEAGVDGPGQEFVFIRLAVQPSIDAYSVESEAYQKAEFLPTTTISGTKYTWTDDPTGVDTDHPIEWVAKRVFKNGKWESFGSPAKWSVFAKDGKSVFVTYNDDNTVSAPSATPPAGGNGNGWHTTPDAKCVWCCQKLASSIEEGTWGPPYRVRGADGTSVNIRGHVANSDALSSISNPSDGDGYITDDNGHLFVWSSTSNSWVDCGKIQGEAGAKAYVHIKYSNDGGTTFTDNNGETVGEYIGMYTDNTPGDSNNVSDYSPWHKIEGDKGEQGEKGDKGDPGSSLTKVNNYYLWHSDGKTAPYSNSASDRSHWSENIIPTHPDSDTLCYLWNYEVCLNDDDEPISTSDPACIGYYPNDGVSIESVTEYYKLGTEATSPPTPSILLSSDSLSVTTTGWETTPPATDATTYRYLWNTEVTKFSDGTYQVNTPHVAGTHGENGEKGDPGRNISKVVNYYAWHNSGTTAPSSWGDADVIPSHPDGKDYLWNYESCSDADHPEYPSIDSDPACIGYYPKDGVGISEISEYYKVNNSATSAPTPSILLSSDSLSVTTTGWSSTPVPTTEENRYLWNCEVIKKSDNTYIVNAPHLAAVQGIRGNDGTTIRPRGTYPNEAAMRKAYADETMSPMPTDGDAYVTSDNGHLWSFSSTYEGNFIDLGPFRGENGQNLSVVINYYAWNGRGTSAPSVSALDTWGEANQIPSHPDGKDYLWNYEVYMSEDAEISRTDPVCIGYYPKDGEDGNDGRGIVSITEYYNVNNSPTSAPSMPSFNTNGSINSFNGWTDTPSQAQTTDSSRYLWNFELTCYTDGSYSHSLPHVAGTKGEKGDQGEQGEKGDKGDDGNPGVQGPRGYNGCAVRTRYWQEAPNHFTETIEYETSISSSDNADTSNAAILQSCFMFVSHYIQGKVRFDSLTIKVKETSTYLGVNSAFSTSWSNEPFEVEFNGAATENCDLTINLSNDIGSHIGKTLIVTLKVTFINCRFGIGEPSAGVGGSDGRNNFKFQWKYKKNLATGETEAQTGYKIFANTRVPIPTGGNAIEWRNDSDIESNGEKYIDIALVEDSDSMTGYQAYMCRVTHTSDYPINKPKSSGSDSYWIKANTLDFLSVNMLLAKYAKIEMASGNQLLIMGTDAYNRNKVLGGISGYGTESDTIRLWIGSSNPDTAPFRVSHEGHVVAEKFATGVSGPRMEVEDGLFKVFGTASDIFPNIKFGIDDETGVAILAFYDNYGNKKYDLGSIYGLRSLSETTFASRFELGEISYFFWDNLTSDDLTASVNIVSYLMAQPTGDIPVGTNGFERKTIYKFVAGRELNQIKGSEASNCDGLYYNNSTMYQGTGDSYTYYPDPSNNTKVNGYMLTSPSMQYDYSAFGLSEGDTLYKSQMKGRLYLNYPVWSKQRDVVIDGGKVLYVRYIAEFVNGSRSMRSVVAMVNPSQTTAIYSDAPDNDPTSSPEGIDSSPSTDSGTSDAETN